MYCISTIYERRTGFYALFCAYFYHPDGDAIQTAITNRIRSTLRNKRCSAAIRDYNGTGAALYPGASDGRRIFTSGGEGINIIQDTISNTCRQTALFETLQNRALLDLFCCSFFILLLCVSGIIGFTGPGILKYELLHWLLIMMFTLLVAQYAQMAFHNIRCALFLCGSCYFHQTG
jgi:hypothetical protein